MIRAGATPKGHFNIIDMASDGANTDGLDHSSVLEFWRSDLSC